MALHACLQRIAFSLALYGGDVQSAKVLFFVSNKIVRCCCNRSPYCAVGEQTGSIVIDCGLGK